MSVKPKKRGLGLEMRTFEDAAGNTYLVFRTKEGAFHVFREVQAKQAVRACGGKAKGHTRQLWQELWNKK